MCGKGSNGRIFKAVHVGYRGDIGERLTEPLNALLNEKSLLLPAGFPIFQKMNVAVRLFRLCGHGLALLAFFMLCDGPLASVQVAAWCGMVVDYSRGTTLAHGLEETFDGAHPCALCRRVAETKKAGSPEVRTELVKEMKCVPPDSVAVVRPVPPKAVVFFVSVFFGLFRVDAPPTPPPRSAMA